MYYMYGDPLYLLLILVTMALGLGTQAFINNRYAKWSEVPASRGVSGSEVARAMLQRGGAGSVGITRVGGHLSDYYDPRDNQLHLSGENFQGGSVASVAVACHEAGHAVQNAEGYGFYRLRSALVPAVNVAQNLWSVVLLLGLFMPYFTIGGYSLINIAIVLYAIPVVFQLVTLPVEIDASRRAVSYLSSTGSYVDEKGAREVLTAAALTYVAAALSSVLQLLYLLSRTRRD